jgi:hypothetical protein
VEVSVGLAAVPAVVEVTGLLSMVGRDVVGAVVRAAVVGMVLSPEQPTSAAQQARSIARTVAWTARANTEGVRS